MRLFSPSERLTALRSYGILDTPAEIAFDDVVELARTLTGAPVALISFVDQDRQWFKAKRGVELDGTGLDNSFCALAVNDDSDMLVIPDAAADSRVREMDIVTGPPGVRAYAGVVLRSSEGAPLGTVCVLDTAPRSFSDAELSSLQALGRQVSAHLELRRAAQERAIGVAALRELNVGYELAMSAARLGRWDHRPAEGERFYDARAREIMGVAADEGISLSRVLDRVHPDDRAALLAEARRVQDADRVGPLDSEFRISHPNGEIRWVSAVGRTLFEDGVCTRFFGVLEDVTERRRAQEQQAYLAGELSHRVKNILTLAQSVAETTLRNAPDLASARRALTGRLQALSQAHDVLLMDHWEAAPVADLVAGAVASLSLEPARIDASGPPLRLNSRAALQLALALHELATNAAKHGSLSTSAGRVVIRWSVEQAEGGPRFRFAWEEEGGPTVVEPSRKGFGARVLERATAAAFQGEVRLVYAPGGVRWSVTAPMAGLREGADAAA